jgi:hypothetical protein
MENVYAYVVASNNERAYVELYDSSKTVFPIATYCTPTTNPSTEEFHVLVKSGNYRLILSKTLLCDTTTQA